MIILHYYSVHTCVYTGIYAYYHRFKTKDIYYVFNELYLRKCHWQKRNNSDRTLMLCEVGIQLENIWLPGSVISFLLCWVNIISENMMRFVISKENRVYRIVGDTIVGLLIPSCFDVKGNVKMSVVTRRMIAWTRNPD